MNAYELLGIDRSADLEEIKRAYRRLAKELHPDVNAGDAQATERFKEITAAYNLLANRRKRVEYDLNRPMPGGEDGAPQSWERGGAWFDFELDETTGERIVDLYGDIAGTRMGRVKGAAATSMCVKGQDIAGDLRVTESEAREGVCKLITTMTGVTVAVTVPAGTANGATVVLPGFGIEGFGGGPPGDLNVLVEVAADPVIASAQDEAD